MTNKNNVYVYTSSMMGSSSSEVLVCSLLRLVPIFNGQAAQDFTASTLIFSLIKGLEIICGFRGWEGSQHSVIPTLHTGNKRNSHCHTSTTNDRQEKLVYHILQECSINELHGICTFELKIICATLAILYSCTDHRLSSIQTYEGQTSCGSCVMVV
jgi:hypothetical protein